MKSLYSLFKALLKNWLRSKTGMFFSLLFPVMLLLIFSTVFGGQEDVQYRIYVQNQDIVEGEETNLSARFIDALEETDTFQIERVDPDVNMTKYLEEEATFGAGKRGLVIPEGFHEDAMDKSIELRAGVMHDTMLYIGDDYWEYMDEAERENYTSGLQSMERWKEELGDKESAEVLLITSDGDQAAPMIRGTVYGVVNTFNQRMLGVEDSTVEIESRSLDTRDLRAVDYYLPAYIAAFIMANGIIGVTSNVSEFKRNGTLKRLAATPLSKLDWILANIAQQTVLAFLLTGLMVLLGVVIFDVQVFPNFYAVGFIFTGAVAFSSIGIVLGGFIKDVEAASGAGNAIAFPMMFLSGAFWSIEAMPGYLQTVARFLPLYHFHQGLMHIMILENPSEALIPFIIILGFAAVFIMMAVKVTKWKEL